MTALSSFQVPGIIGGLGPASTVDYYNGIISGFRAAVHQDIYPRIVIDSVNMTAILKDVSEKRYDALTDKLAESVYRLKRAGADFAAIASNTPHVVFERLKKCACLPLISIVDATVSYAAAHHWQRILFTGTLFTMNNSFYPEAFQKAGIECLMPPPADREKIHSIIFPDLEQGIVTPAMKARFLSVCNPLFENERVQGHPVEALVLGCTEIPLLIHDGDVPIPLINTTAVHIAAVVSHLVRP